MKEKVRYLRQQQTDTERLLWSRLRNRQIAGCKFRRQYAIGSYIVDFICVERALVVEIDGAGNMRTRRFMMHNVQSIWNREDIWSFDFGTMKC